MPGIPLNPALINGAKTFVTPLAAYSSSITKKPQDPMTKQPQDGARFVPMQFVFNAQANWLVDLSAITPINPITQCTSMYVDNSQSTHDVAILFADSGWEATVQAANTAMLNPLTTAALPKFYVILSGGINASDVTNIFAIDTFVPPLATAYQKNVNAVSVTNFPAGFDILNFPASTPQQIEGVGQLSAVEKYYVGSKPFTGVYDYTLTNAGADIITATQWYLTEAHVTVSGTIGSTTVATVVALLDNGVPIAQCGFTPEPNGASLDLKECINLTQMNYTSSGTGHLTILTSPSTLGRGTFTVNLSGGILVP